MGRVGLIMGGLALVIVALSSLIPLIGSLVVAPLATILLGAGAGWWASKVAGIGTAGRGAGAGAITGLGALIGSGIGLVVLVMISANNPEVQRQIQEMMRTIQSENPDATMPDSAQLGTAMTAAGAMLGFCVGLIDLFLATIAGLIAGLIYGRNRQPAAATLPGTYSDLSLPRSDLPTAQPDSGARIYDDTSTDRTTNKLEESDHQARIYPDDEQHR